MELGTVEIRDTFEHWHVNWYLDNSFVTLATVTSYEVAVSIYENESMVNALKLAFITNAMDQAS
jgi:hypothetical protein